MTALSVLFAVFGQVVEMSLPAALVVGFVLVVQRVFGRRLSARFRHMLWGLLIVRLLLLWTPTMPFGLIDPIPAPGLDAEALQNVAPVVADAAPAMHSFARLTREMFQISSTGARSVSWGALLPFAWLAGALAFAVFVGIQSWQLPRSFGPTRPVSDPVVVALLQRCAHAMGRRRVPALLAAEHLRGPVVYGIVHPRMVIPEWQLARLTGDELRHVMLHELAHLKRRDLPVAVLAAVLQAVHWFNPFVWYGFHRMRQDREYACDALVLAHLAPHEAAAYGKTLVKLMRRPAPKRLAAAAVYEHGSKLEKRLEMIMNPISRSTRIPWIVMALVVLSAAPLFTRATAAPLPTPEAPALSSCSDNFAYEIPIETYETSWSGFREGDSITVTELHGTSPSIAAGERYRLTGRYVLQSAPSAQLMQFCTNGETAGVGAGNSTVVERGSGEFTFEFVVVRPGMLHVSYYPAGGGEGFGGCYFRGQPLADDDPNAHVDLAVDEGAFTLAMNERWNGYSLNARIENRGNAVSPPFTIYFYRGDPATAEPQTHQGGPLYPGETWSESSLPVDLTEGENTFYVVLDADDRIAESDETNNGASVTARGRKVLKKVIELELGE